ncbi:MAG TPA: hypothetical protein VE973_03555, partial [Candidatus Limnocylindria bacterium]|nr:hypothetical protein [Candidatus Limnocylindria bacterium]
MSLLDNKTDLKIFKDKMSLEVQEAEFGILSGFRGLPKYLRWSLVSMAVAIIPAYFIAFFISQKVWVDSYAQTLPIARPSFSQVYDLQKSAISVINLGQGSFAAIVKITNPNLDVALSNAPYKFIFYNAQKQEIYKSSGILYILPDETKYLTVPAFTPTDVIAYTDIQLPDTLPWQKRLKIPKVNLQRSTPNTS